MNLPDTTLPILRAKHSARPLVFRPENLLREARRQKGLAEGEVPPICVLDPDGDIVRTLSAAQRAARNPTWACYHTDLHSFAWEGLELGVVGCAVAVTAPAGRRRKAAWTDRPQFIHTDYRAVWGRAGVERDDQPNAQFLRNARGACPSPTAHDHLGAADPAGGGDCLVIRRGW